MGIFHGDLFVYKRVNKGPTHVFWWRRIEVDLFGRDSGCYECCIKRRPMYQMYQATNFWPKKLPKLHILLYWNFPFQFRVHPWKLIAKAPEKWWLGTTFAGFLQGQTRWPSTWRLVEAPQAAASVFPRWFKPWPTFIPKLEVTRNHLENHLGVSKNRGTSKSSILTGFSIIFTIHFGGFSPYSGLTPTTNLPFRSQRTARITFMNRFMKLLRKWNVTCIFWRRCSLTSEIYINILLIIIIIYIYIYYIYWLVLNP